MLDATSERQSTVADPIIDGSGEVDCKVQGQRGPGVKTPNAKNIYNVKAI